MSNSVVSNIGVVSPILDIRNNPIKPFRSETVYLDLCSEFVPLVVCLALAKPPGALVTSPAENENAAQLSNGEILGIHTQ